MENWVKMIGPRVEVRMEEKDWICHVVITHKLVLGIK